MCVRLLSSPSLSTLTATRRDAWRSVSFKRSLELVDYDLKAWRELAEQRKENAEGFELLDKYGGFGLLEGCFRRDPNKRISAAAAAGSGFCRA